MPKKVNVNVKPKSAKQQKKVNQKNLKRQKKKALSGKAFGRMSREQKDNLLLILAAEAGYIDEKGKVTSE